MTRRRLAWSAGLIAIVYGLVCLDVVMRAKQAYLEGEKAANPREAFAWYETAATQFTPPESVWSRRARAKMPLAKERWKADLKSRHISFDDSMLE